MAVWREQVVPRIVNVALGDKESMRWRAKACAGLHGDVVEVGFGSALNVDHYPEAVTSVSAVEPAKLGPKLGAERIARSRAPITFVGLDGQKLDLPDDRFDTALSTWTLCTIPDAVAALRELHRVLKPGGTLHFVEHGYAPDPKVARWQQRLDPVQKRVAGGCHLSRPIDELLAAGGFTVEQLENAYMKGAPKPFSYLYVGVARAG